MAVALLKMLREFSWIEGLIIGLSLAGYAVIAYVFTQNDFFALFTAFSVLFGAYLYLGTRKGYSNRKVIMLLAVGFLFRLVFMPAAPTLSDDYKRFLWDGNLLHQGINPYHYQPTEISDEIENFNPAWEELVFAKDRYTAYPPVMQACFFLAATFSEPRMQIIGLRLCVLLIEMGIIMLLFRLMPLFQLPKRHVLLYGLNPLAIIELSGNLHLEGAMVFFTLLAVYFWKKGQVGIAGISLSGAILSRLVPAVFLPVFVKRPLRRKDLTFILTTLVLAAAGFALIGWKGLMNMRQSLGLYFSYFEFNGSIYYIIRWIGYQTHGYNIIHLVAPYLKSASAALILALAIRHWFRPFSNPFQYITFFLTGYYLLATTLNPWYVVPVAAFGIFYKPIFTTAWTFAIFLSYHAYQGSGVHESGWILLAEYGILAAAMIYDFVIKPRNDDG